MKPNIGFLHVINRDIMMWLVYYTSGKSSWFLLPSQCICQRTLASVSHHKYQWRTFYFLPWQHLTFQSLLKFTQGSAGLHWNYTYAPKKLAYYFKMNAFFVLFCPVSSISILLKIRKIHQQWWIMQYVLFVAETKGTHEHLPAYTIAFIV